MRPASPLRYPGGKASLANLLAQVIHLNQLEGSCYYEAYAGGAGAALSLLREGVVSGIQINDADFRVYSFWKAAILDTDRFVERIFKVPLEIEEWQRQREICVHPASHSPFEVGFAAFYMNRCNRSGVLTGAGPIGGHAQSGKWRLGVRFCREALAERVMEIAKFRSDIGIHNLDAVDFLKTKLPKGSGRRRSFVYLDPPYVVKGQRLYLNAYAPKDHSYVSKYLEAQSTLPWIMSYDDAELIRKLYAKHQIFNLPIRYSLQEKRSAKELVIAPHHVRLPKIFRMYGQDVLMGSPI